MGLKEKCGEKKGSGDPGVGRLTQAKAEGRTRGCQGASGQPRPAPTAAAAPDTGTLVAQGKEVRGRDVANETGFEEMGPYWQVPAGEGRDGAASSSSAAQRGRWKAGESPTVSPHSSPTGWATGLQAAGEAGPGTP